MAGVYISYPFCAQKCAYCNFASGVASRRMEEEYLQALRVELQGASWPWTPETVYIGGGTPSRISPDALRCLLGLVPGRPWQEATIEAAPGTVTEALSEAWREGGITRVSLGVQSFAEPEIRVTGRKHTAQTVEREIELLRRHGIHRINIDLIAGLPHQTRDSWQFSLEWVRRLQPEHVSVYMLEVDEDSRLGREILHHGRRYGAPEAPGEETVTALYEEAVRQLVGWGWRRYEISNFALPGCESIHNLKYWRRSPYLGFGADAHSFDGNARWRNVEDAAEYLGRVLIGRSPVESFDPAEPEFERFMLGLRLSEGVKVESSDWERYGQAIGKAIEEGLLEFRGGRLRLTARGVLFSNEVLQEFLPA